MTRAPERSRPSLRPPAPQIAHDGGAWLPALRLALRTSAVGLVVVELVVLALWATTGGSGAGALDAVRTGLAFWTAAHHAGIRVGTATLGVVPLGLTLLPAVLLYRGARGALDRDPDLEPVAYLPALAVCYGVVTAAVALAARGPVVRPIPAQAFLGAAVLAVAAGAVAALRARGVPTRVPPAAVAAVEAAARALAALLGAGLVLALVVVAAAHRDVTAAAGALHPGASGAVGLTLLDLLAVPHLALYGTSVLAGPGFALGVHTSVSVAGAHLGAVPALPVLAALPRTGSFPAVTAALLAVPVCCGSVAARRALRDVGHWRAELRQVGGFVLAGGVGAAVLGWLADGSAGPHRLAVSGPSPWRTGLAVAVEFGLGALLVVGLRAWRRRGRR